MKIPKPKLHDGLIDLEKIYGTTEETNPFRVGNLDPVIRRCHDAEARAEQAERKGFTHAYCDECEEEVLVRFGELKKDAKDLIKGPFADIVCSVCREIIATVSRPEE